MQLSPDQILSVVRILEENLKGNPELPESLKALAPGLLALLGIAATELGKEHSPADLAFAKPEDVEAIRRLKDEYETALRDKEKLAAEAVKRATQRVSSLAAEVWQKKSAQLDLRQKGLEQDLEKLNRAQIEHDLQKESLRRAKEEHALEQEALDAREEAVSEGESLLAGKVAEAEQLSAQAMTAKAHAEESLRQSTTLADQCRSAETRIREERELLEEMKKEIAIERRDLDDLLILEGQEVLDLLIKVGVV